MTSHTVDRIKVLRYTPCWLPQTMTWVYTHTRSLPEQFESLVVCQWSENLDQFGLKHIRSANRPPKPDSLFQKVLYRLGIGSDEKATQNLLERVIQEAKPDILHSHFGNCGWANSKVATK